MTEVWSQTVDVSDYTAADAWLHISVETGSVTELILDIPSNVQMWPRIDNVAIVEAVDDKTIDENSSHTFSAADFAFSDIDGHSLHSVKITQLPGAGSLKLNGVDVTANQVIAAADISNLVFTPDANANGADYATVTYSVSDGTQESTASTLTFDVNSVEYAPTAADSAVTLDEDDSHTFSVSDFGFSDSDGDALHSIKVTQLPAAGSLTLNGSAVTANQVIAAADIPNLVFTPADGCEWCWLRQF